MYPLQNELKSYHAALTVCMFFREFDTPAAVTASEEKGSLRPCERRWRKQVKYRVVLILPEKASQRC